jgi:hypothetical protein
MTLFVGTSPATRAGEDALSVSGRAAGFGGEHGRDAQVGIMEQLCTLQRKREADEAQSALRAELDDHPGGLSDPRRRGRRPTSSGITQARKPVWVRRFWPMFSKAWRSRWPQWTQQSPPPNSTSPAALRRSGPSSACATTMPR